MATTTVTPEIDLEKAEAMSMDELRKAAGEEAKKQSTSTTAATAEEETTTEEDEEEQPKEFVAERSIDLGDGAGVQVFKGKGETREAALEQLSDNLAEAQKNATKKIRELNKTTKTTTTTTVTPTKEDESLLAAELVTTPTQAVLKILKRKGIDLDELKDVTVEVKQDKAAKQRKSIADQFVINHPEFLDNDTNGKRLAKAVTLQGAFTLENLEKAYQDLNESGLLEVKGEEAGDGQDKNKSKGGDSTTKTEVTPSQRTKKSSGLSTQRRTAAPTNQTPSEDDMYAMPLDELKKRANLQLSGK